MHGQCIFLSFNLYLNEQIQNAIFFFSMLFKNFGRTFFWLSCNYNLISSCFVQKTSFDEGQYWPNVMLNLLAFHEVVSLCFLFNRIYILLHIVSEILIVNAANSVAFPPQIQALRQMQFFTKKEWLWIVVFWLTKLITKFFYCIKERNNENRQVR